MTSLSHSPEETQSLAASFSATLKGGEIIALEGDLGTGKTTFVQGVASALGSVDLVRSPTFTILNVYRTNHPVIRQIVHIDGYRLRNEEDIVNLGLDEWVERPDTILFIEWPKTVPEAILPADVEIRFAYGERETERHITITIET